MSLQSFTLMLKYAAVLCCDDINLAALEKHTKKYNGRNFLHQFFIFGGGGG